MVKRRWQRETLDAYFDSGGDQTWRLDHYDFLIGDDGIIIEIGAYNGFFTEMLADKFPEAIIVALEPVPSLFAEAEARLQGREKVILSNSGLWNSPESYHYDFSLPMTDDGAASTVIPSLEQRDGVRARFFDIGSYLEMFGDIDLLVMNVEGSEYELLPRILETDAIKRIKNLQIQFHDVADDSFDKMVAIRDDLARTHFLTYRFEFVMENWRRR